MTPEAAVPIMAIHRMLFFFMTRSRMMTSREPGMASSEGIVSTSLTSVALTIGYAAAISAIAGVENAFAYWNARMHKTAILTMRPNSPFAFLRFTMGSLSSP